MPNPSARRSARPSHLLRWALVVGVIVSTAFGLSALLGLIDSTVTLWQRIQQLPPWISAGFVLAAAALICASGWLMWRLLRTPSKREAVADAIDRPRLEKRIAALEVPGAALAEELHELDRRRAADVVQVALFGDISSGKSSLLIALAPRSAANVNVIGGTTRRVEHAAGLLPDGRTLQIADVPGVNESTGEGRAALAKDEAARAHALVFVADGDLTRSQDHELRALLATGRPLILALNKSDRYRDDERAALIGRLRERYPAPQVKVIAVSAGYVELITREHADGRREQVERAQTPRVDELLTALSVVVKRGAAAMEPARELATLERLDQRLASSEIEHRKSSAEACITRYTRRALVGAMAAVAPGTDLLIQGALATAMIRELCAIYDLKARDIDLDELIKGAGSTARSSTALTLAIAGNAMKAFPGAGTLAGGMVHALAYGLLFDALGRAVADTLAGARSLDREATLAAFKDALSSTSRERLRALATLAWDSARGLDRSSRSILEHPNAGHSDHAD